MEETQEDQTTRGVRSAKSKAYLLRGVGILASSGHNKLER